MINIIGFARTPIAPVLGQLASISAVKLGSLALEAALRNNFIKASAVDHLIYSHCFPAGCGPFPGKRIAAAVGCCNGTNCFKVNQQCTSGLQATCIASDLIRLQRSNTVAVSKSTASIRNGRCLGFGLGDVSLVDSLQGDGIEKYKKVVNDLCQSYNISKLEIDKYAMESFHRTASCYSDGIMQNELVPITVCQGPKKRTRPGAWISPTHITISEDIYYKSFDLKSMDCTNSNAIAPMGDGAAALILASDECIPPVAPIARIVGYTQATLPSNEFPQALVDAIRRLVKETRVQHVDIYDIMDQYAIIPIYAMQRLNLDISKVNVNGSTLSLGHVSGLLYFHLKLKQACLELGKLYP
ncbi:bifunctional Thiolase [Babesia duncani]|uniref:Bifunctional Thiolase n=1 Tax=Babesia duncani TaxID=323732 RepID=A0AAD9PN32_9APIC|nr:bifunctional Thiolase [Babesia duncani]